MVSNLTDSNICLEQNESLIGNPRKPILLPKVTKPLKTSKIPRKEQIEENGLTKAKKIDTLPRGISLKDILDNLTLTRSLTKTARILGCSKQNINQRLKANNIDIDIYLDFKDTKTQHYESLQARLLRTLDTESLKKAPVGSKILALCQLEDKVRLLQGHIVDISIHTEIRASSARLQELRAMLEGGA